MTPTPHFEDQISRVKRAALLRTIARLALVTIFLCLCGYTVIIIFERFVHIPFKATSQIYAGVIAGAFAAALIYSVATRRGFLELLIDIDARLKLRDRLSTAYEYQTQGKPSEFFELLVADASQRLSTLTSSQLFPFRFSRLHLLILVIVLLNAFLIGISLIRPPQEFATPVDPQVSEQLQKAIQDYLQKNPQQDQQAQLKQDARQKLRQHMEEMDRQLRQQTMNRKQVIESLRETLKEIQSQRDHLTQELENNLKNLENIRELPVRQMPQLQRLSSSGLKKLEKMFGQALDGELPEDIRQNMESLSHYQEMEGPLEEMLEDLEGTGKEDDAVAEGEQAPGDSEQPADKRDLASGQDPRNGEGSPSDDLPLGEEGDFEHVFRGQSFPGMEGQDPDDDLLSREPGTSPGDGQRNPPSTIERTRDMPLQDRMAPSQRAEYRRHIRSVTTIGNATVPEEELTRTYEREVESVLQKEDIPLNYREYIKNYFLSIGVMNEE